MIPRSPGTYIVLMTLEQAAEIKVRRGRVWRLEPGLYGYVGSARGPGGLAARLRRHCSNPARKHWHVDYLAPLTSVVGVLCIQSVDRLECGWAEWIRARAAQTIEGFGSSDCSCDGHLFRLGPGPLGRSLKDAARNDLGARFVPSSSIGRQSSRSSTPRG